jgi:hypothetical protein
VNEEETIFMQFRTKLGLVDIPNAEVLAAADQIRGDETTKLREALKFVKSELCEDELVLHRAINEALF